MVVLLLVRGIHEHYADHKRREALCEISNVDSAEGPTDQYIGTWRPLGFKEHVQIIDDFIGRLKMGDFVSAAFARTIIAADLREPFNIRLHGFPCFEAGSQAR